MHDETMTRPSGERGGGSERLTLLVRAVYSEGAPLSEVRAQPVGTFGGGGERELVLGRQPGTEGRTWPLAFDPTLSRRHARLRLVALGSDDALVVEDLGSHNGTWLDGVRLTAPAAVRPGQVLRVAGTLLVVGAAPIERADRIRREAPPPPAYVALSWASLEAWEHVARIAKSDAGVLLTGPVGTGKTRLAQHLHERSGRTGPFVAFNCSAIPVNLEEATLFGVASGFIPGVREREGWVVRARAGTLFLDELAEMPLVAQAKLLDAFDPTDPGFIPVGGTARVRPTCRLVSATNRDVFALAAAGTLRQDLLSRIVVAQVAVPSLAERREDLIELLARALRRRGATLEGAVPTAELAEALLLARWTENVRGLESLAARLSLGERLLPDEVRRHAERGLEAAPVSGAHGRAPATSADLAPPAPVRPLRPLWPPEPAELLTLLREHDFNVAAAAAAIGRRRETLSRLTTATFGAGGAAAARRAWRIYDETGRVPPREE